MLDYSKLKCPGLILFLFSNSIFSASGHVYLSGSVGASFAASGNTNPQINYLNGLTDEYPVRGNNVTTALFSVNGGYELTGINSKLGMALGLGIYDTLGNYNYKGYLIETAIGDPDSILNKYKYNVKSTRILLEAQANWMLNQFIPYINVGIGSAWNHLSGYSEMSVACDGCIALPPFQAHTNTNFSYQVGIGMAYTINLLKHMNQSFQERLSLGYRYANLGDASFKMRDVVYPYSLDTGCYFAP